MIASNNDIRTIRPDDFAELQKKGTLRIIDVRTPAEFEELRLSDAKNHPLDQLNPDSLLSFNANEPLYVVCRSGARGLKACEKLVSAGISNVVNIEGGTLACEQAGLTVIRGRKMISLMRQVQITVGSLGFIGSVLALTVDPLFAGIPAFFCGGLLFAGLTDTCMLAMLLAKMPWNHRAVACNRS
jgi:rhodanese-related sulfurtransferase